MLCRVSSSTVTRAGLSLVIPAIIADAACSPEASETTKEGPKSQNTVPKTPRVSATMTTMPRPWQWSAMVATLLRGWVESGRRE